MRECMNHTVMQNTLPCPNSCVSSVHSFVWMLFQPAYCYLASYHMKMYQVTWKVDGKYCWQLSQCRRIDRVAISDILPYNFLMFCTTVLQPLFLSGASINTTLDVIQSSTRQTNHNSLQFIWKLDLVQMYSLYTLILGCDHHRLSMLHSFQTATSTCNTKKGHMVATMEYYCVTYCMVYCCFLLAAFSLKILEFWIFILFYFFNIKQTNKNLYIIMSITLQQLPWPNYLGKCVLAKLIVKCY